MKNLRPAMEIVEEMGQMDSTPDGKHWTPDMEGMAKLIDKERRKAIREALKESDRLWDKKVEKLQEVIENLEEEFVQPIFV
jgi:coenzyme F420-reducing hydrogenase alpha subunit